MEAVTCRLLPFATFDGPTNMAADEVMVQTAAADGVASLRFYGWNEATVSLGYFQPAAARLTDPRLAPLPFVRRPSGGATLVHHHELTYCLALPPGRPWQAGEPWMIRMHHVIAAALTEFGVGRVMLVEGPAVRHGDVLCFQQFTPGDLLCAGRKVVGSAQRKHRQALMQHGSILLAQSEHTPSLPGIAELAGVTLRAECLAASLAAALGRETGWRLVASDGRDAERHEMAELAAEKYRSPQWNEKR